MKRINISSQSPFEGVFGYSRVVRVGNQVHVAGTTAQPPEDQGDAYEQAAAALKIIRKGLVEAGVDFKNVVRTVVYITDMKYAEHVTRAHCEVFRQILPVSTLVAISALAKPHLVVEIEAYAISENNE